MDNIFQNYLSTLLEQLGHSGSTLLAILLVCAIVGAAVKTTAFTVVKLMGKSEHAAARASSFSMALMFAVCFVVTFQFAFETARF